MKTIFLLLLSLATISNQAEAQRWEHLGSRVVNWGLDRDVIPVTWREGKFDALRLEVRGGNVNMHRMIVHFENGAIQEIELRQRFRRGAESRVIDLAGNNRFIEKVVFVYDTQNRSRRKAVVSLFGRH